MRCALLPLVCRARLPRSTRRSVGTNVSSMTGWRDLSRQSSNRSRSVSKDIHLGFEVGTGKPVAVPLLNLAVTGQTQTSGKTTALEALAARSKATVLAFVTKRGEASFSRGYHLVQPYFRDRADWQFVDSIMEAALNEKHKV